MRSYRWEGTATALTSITHGGDTLGTVTYLRREAFLTPQGRLDIPVISGNSVRGTLRDIGAAMLWEHLGRPPLPLPVMHALWSGGALVKTKAQPLTGQRLADLRRMVAHLGCFGAAGGGRIIDGAAVVSKMVPLSRQTAHLLPEALADDDLPDIQDLVQIERYTRLPDADRHPDVLAATTPDEADYEDGLMRYGTETFIAGTRFHVSFALRNATDDEHSFFTDVLDAYLPTATVGGRIGRGHGKVAYTLDTQDPEPAGEWRTLGGATTTDVIEALNWLD